MSEVEELRRQLEAKDEENRSLKVKQTGQQHAAICGAAMPCMSDLSGCRKTRHNMFRTIISVKANCGLRRETLCLQEQVRQLSFQLAAVKGSSSSRVLLPA